MSFIESAKDDEILGQVQQRFAVKMPELPDHIDVASYSS